MEAQSGIRLLRRTCAPLYEAALASGDYAVMAETKALADTLRVAQLQARRLTGFAETVSCPDGRAGLFHGRAA
jgi:hypothetical protein